MLGLILPASPVTTWRLMALAIILARLMLEHPRLNQNTSDGHAMYHRESLDMHPSGNLLRARKLRDQACPLCLED